MVKAAKKKPAARKHAPKPADGDLAAKRANAYLVMEPLLRDCQRWAHLVDTLATDDDPAILALVAEHAANEIDKLVEVYYAPDPID